MGYLALTCNPKLNPQPIYKPRPIEGKKEKKISSNKMKMGGNSI